MPDFSEVICAVLSAFTCAEKLMRMGSAKISLKFVGYGGTLKKVM
jgi:hypothetical protein